MTMRRSCNRQLRQLRPSSIHCAMACQIIEANLKIEYCTYITVTNQKLPIKNSTPCGKTQGKRVCACALLSFVRALSKADGFSRGPNLWLLCHFSSQLPDKLGSYHRRHRCKEERSKGQDGRFLRCQCAANVSRKYARHSVRRPKRIFDAENQYLPEG